MPQKKVKNNKTEPVERQITTFNINKLDNFSEWFTEIVKRAELADMRYNVKGFIAAQQGAIGVAAQHFNFGVLGDFAV